MSIATKIKDPDAVLDFKFDFKTETNGRGFADWLESGETITSHVITVESGLTKDSSSITDTGTTVSVWLSGGTAGVEYTVACKIVTSAGRTDERTRTISVVER